MRYLIDPKHGSAYWCDADALMFAPLSTDSTFDTEEAGAVDFALLDEQDRGTVEGIKETLC